MIWYCIKLKGQVSQESAEMREQCQGKTTKEFRTQNSNNGKFVCLWKSDKLAFDFLTVIKGIVLKWIVLCFEREACRKIYNPLTPRLTVLIMYYGIVLNGNKSYK